MEEASGHDSPGQSDGRPGTGERRQIVASTFSIRGTEVDHLPSRDGLAGLTPHVTASEQCKGGVEEDRGILSQGAQARAGFPAGRASTSSAILHDWRSPGATHLAFSTLEDSTWATASTIHHFGESHLGHTSAISRAATATANELSPGGNTSPVAPPPFSTFPKCWFPLWSMVVGAAEQASSKSETSPWSDQEEVPTVFGR